MTPRPPYLIVGRPQYCDMHQGYVDDGVIHFGDEDERLMNICRPCFDQAARCWEEQR